MSVLERVHFPSIHSVLEPERQFMVPIQVFPQPLASSPSDSMSTTDLQGPMDTTEEEQQAMEHADNTVGPHDERVNTTRNLRRLSTIVFERIKDFQDSRLFMSIRKVLEFTTIEALMRKRQQ